MSEWKEVSLSELGKTITGKTPSSQYPEDFGDEVPFITPSDSFEKKYISRSERYLSRLGSDRLKDKIISSDSIMVTCIGSAMGKVAKNSLPSVTNQQINSIIVNENFDSDYIYYLFKNNYAVFRNAASGSTAIPILNKTDFDNLRFKVELDLNQQRKMVSILSKIDDKIEINNQINQELEAMAKTLYNYWFVQFDFPDQNGKPYKSSGGKMVYHPELKREIPEGWGVENLFDIADVQYGYPFSTDYFNGTGEGVPVIRIRDILGNDITNYSTEEVEDKYKINVGDVLIGMDGNFHMNYWIKEDCYLNQRVVKVNSDKLPNMVLKYQIEPFIRLREKSVSRTTVGHLSDKDLKAINVILPKDKYLSSIFEKFESILENIIINQQQNQELTQLRDWLLPMLMNGQVKVE
ncbi:MAG: restriction endonuclease subunit S [Fusobacterium periodonticum]|nr:restriction endonuclease subunit S [Fusobacterium periodonticum]